jgi:DHA1 family bicyclomycin/chloramphenicol resistance-like MFS transporter
VNDIGSQQLGERPRTDTGTPWGLLLLLMAMTAIGPTTLNVVVPALPGLSHALGSNIAGVQLAVTGYLLALATGQLVMGPLSDRFGRRPVVIAGLALTAVASVLALAISNVWGLVLARVLQAIGASAGIVVSRAIIRDLFDRDRAAAMIGLVATVMVVAPTFGPLIGGLLDTEFGWESIFLFTALTTAAVVAWAAITLRETRNFDSPEGAGEGFFRDLARLAASAKFAGYVLTGGFGSSTFFAFLGGGPYVVVTLMGRSSAEFGLWFVVSSFGYMAGNFAASRLSTRLGIDRLIWWGIAWEIFGVVIATALAAFAEHWGPAIVFVPQMIIAFGNGLLLPGAIAGAVSIRPQAAGTAAGISGCAQMGVGALVAQFAGTMLAGAASALPLALLMAALTAALALSFALLVGRRF